MCEGASNFTHCERVSHFFCPGCFVYIEIMEMKGGFLIVISFRAFHLLRDGWMDRRMWFSGLTVFHIVCRNPESMHTDREGS